MVRSACDQASRSVQAYHYISLQQGDSGGGLIQGQTNNTDQAILVGIASHGTEPCIGPDFDIPIFTNVGAICAWVESVIQRL